jgi:hypothetical protein
MRDKAFKSHSVCLNHESSRRAASVTGAGGSASALSWLTGSVTQALAAARVDLIWNPD